MLKTPKNAGTMFMPVKRPTPWYFRNWKDSVFAAFVVRL